MNPKTSKKFKTPTSNRDSLKIKILLRIQRLFQSWLYYILYNKSCYSTLLLNCTLQQIKIHPVSSSSLKVKLIFTYLPCSTFSFSFPTKQESVRDQRDFHSSVTFSVKSLQLQNEEGSLYTTVFWFTTSPWPH